MSGVAVITNRLLAYSALTAVVPASQIYPGIIPDGTPLPAIAVSLVDALPRNTVSMRESHGVSRDRVQVTVQAETYPAKDQILALVLRACPNQRGTINGFSVLSILPDGVGPDIDSINPNIFVKSRDFIVAWLEQR